jgi:O-methyltransferase involved in polyketide biosynthesis
VSRARSSKWRIEGLFDRYARDFIGLVGEPPEARSLHPSMAYGVAARSRAVFAAMRKEAERLSSQGESYEIWLIGCGFHSRCETEAIDALPGCIARVVDLDLPALIDIKHELLQPYKQRDVSIVRMSCDTKELAERLSNADHAVIAVIEGRFDYLDHVTRAAVLRSLAARAPRSLLILDSLSERGAEFDNRQPERYTGSPDLRLLGVPDDAGWYFLQLGWTLTSSVPLFVEMRDILASRAPLLGALRRLPLPSSIRPLYRLFNLRPLREL